MLMLPDFRVRQRDFLLQISRAITAQLDLTEVLRRVLHASVAMVAGQVGLVALRAPDGNFYVRAHSGLSREQIPEINEQLRSLIASLEQDSNTDALNDKLREMSQIVDPDLKQSIALPLSFAGDPLGLLIVFRSYRSTVTPNDVQVLQSFADQASIAVHNAQLYADINRERMRLQAILDHSADGIMILDQNLVILHFNATLERLTGWSAEEAVHMFHDAVLQWENIVRPDLQDALDLGWPYRMPAHGAAQGSAAQSSTAQNSAGQTDEMPVENPAANTLYVEGDLISKSGMRTSVAITYAPMLSQDNQLTNIVANVRDITNFREAQEMQNVFISGISHELKTPVAIIKGYAATLRREDATWDEQTILNTLGVIEDEADRLTNLIQNLLTASKLQAQRELNLDLAEFYVSHLAEQVVERFSKQTNTHEFRLNFPDDFPFVQADEVRIRQVLDNLVGNAIKYSPNGGVIEIGGERLAEGAVRVYVRDQGVGISERDTERVFDRFYRVDGKLSRRTQGTGLGLFLARAIIQAHHGVIGVESKLGDGSEFYFILPLRQTKNYGEP